MLTRRFAAVASAILAMCGLTREEFAKLPRFAPRPSRRTVDFYTRRASRNRYTGAMLRAIRANGQHRECARRLARLQAAAA